MRGPLHPASTVSKDSDYLPPLSSKQISHRSLLRGCAACPTLQAFSASPRCKLRAGLSQRACVVPPYWTKHAPSTLLNHPTAFQPAQQSCFLRSPRSDFQSWRCWCCMLAVIVLRWSCSLCCFRIGFPDGEEVIRVACETYVIALVCLLKTRKCLCPMARPT